MTTIILSRHGHVDWIAPERFRGRVDLPLSDIGKRQAESLGECVAKTWKPDVLYTSPLSRCVDTARRITQTTGTQAKTLDLLMDIDYGEWQGLTHDKAYSTWPEEYRLWLRSPDLANIPGGESLAQVQSRSTKILQLILKQHQDQTVVMVGHDSINRVLLLQMLGLPLSNYWKITQQPCCINEASFKNDTFTIVTLNRPSQL